MRINAQYTQFTRPCVSAVDYNMEYICQSVTDAFECVWPTGERMATERAENKTGGDWVLLNQDGDVISSTAVPAPNVHYEDEDKIEHMYGQIPMDSLEYATHAVCAFSICLFLPFSLFLFDNFFRRI
ncbi:unnamed protein product [Bursaphelenchus xylophilus]|uniref:(pine wood nematode) hypothetical protein n=1 Tax=Bursaphelenchus xylophilus TaxID=6326 RepID=A0A1I7RYK0_BURXY|nr:unnamed protein product [Bursaphelenchus xylophilus]CAG9092600.1 unnamed protein product [Bursaphelenchus xylophilus]